jgi:uncharacterized repeat protein (TIGR03803 family)
VAYQSLYSFQGGSGDGANPQAGLLDVEGTLYGTTESGGPNGYGTVFAIAPSGTETVLHYFGTGSGDGTFPQAGLINVNGTLYGTTFQGGTHDLGTVFAITPSGTETLLYSFMGKCNGSCTDAAYPLAGLLDVNGTLYGTSQQGGANNLGTVFTITPSGTETVLYGFKGGKVRDGQFPQAGLINVKGTLYGTTYEGGPQGVRNRLRGYAFRNGKGTASLRPQLRGWRKPGGGPHRRQGQTLRYNLQWGRV